MRPNDGQIAEALRQLGLVPEARYAFGNDAVFVTDVGQDGDNVLLDDSGILRFIDPIVGFKEPAQKMLADPSALEAEIDGIVYNLYGLTPEEREIVENAVKR